VGDSVAPLLHAVHVNSNSSRTVDHV